MGTQLEEIQDRLLAGIEKAADLQALEALRVAALGKQGEITSLMKGLGAFSPEERKEKGELFNVLRQNVTQAFESKRDVLEIHALTAALETQRVDVTLPVVDHAQGRIHPLSQAMFEALEILSSMGFSAAEGPDIETDFYNFTALNMPAEHPARQDQDTFYFSNASDAKEQYLLRTQTSGVQIRTMLTSQPPIKIVAPGRVYRSDYDQTHTPVFHQIEGLFVDKGLHMGHLKGCLIEFCRRYFDNPKLPVRFRPAYFPFTEPSAEIDIGCKRVGGQLIIGEGDEWLEILGAGMVHRNVLTNCHIDPDEYQGFAFGMGVERIAMIKYGIHDLRAFYESDVRWLKHYGSSAFQGLMGGGTL